MSAVFFGAELYLGAGQLNASAVTAQQLALLEINWSLPCGKPVSK